LSYFILQTFSPYQIIDVAKTKVQMFGTKIEITLVKKPPTNQWPKLDFPRQTAEPVAQQTTDTPVDVAEDSDSDVDLDSIEAVRGCNITELD
jgi:cysteine and histidine-rich domain-containing protein